VIDLTRITAFDWDAGNARKNDKHTVSQAEAEQIFFNDPVLIVADSGHCSTEVRYHALGITDNGRLLHVTITLRYGATKIRVISARDMHRKERAVYEKII
jgi:uncharacterized DUF497 family protein